MRSIEDASVLKLLADRKIPLELCPTSNLNTRVFETLADYPLKKLMDSGVIVTINSDNPIVSATNVKHEMQILKEQFQLSDEDIRQLLINAANASFADAGTKEYIKNSRITCQSRQ